MSQSQKTASFALQAFEEDLPTLERSLEAVANEVHDCLTTSDPDQERLIVLKNLSDEMLEQFEVEELARDPSDGRAKVAMMKSIMADAFQDFETALRYDLESLTLAKGDAATAKALNNVSSGYRRLGRHTEALAYAERCLALAGHTGWAVANWFAAVLQVSGSATAVAEALPLVTELDAEALTTFVKHFELDGDLANTRQEPTISRFLDTLR